MNKTRSRNKKIAVGVGVGVAAVGATYLISKNRKLKKANSALGKDNDALLDAAGRLAGRNKGLKGENARLTDSLNRWNKKLLESDNDAELVGKLEKLGHATTNDLFGSKSQTKGLQERFDSFRKEVINRSHTSALKENASRAKKSAGQKNRYTKEKALRAKGFVKKFIEKGDNITLNNHGKTKDLGKAAKRTAVWIDQLGNKILG